MSVRCNLVTLIIIGNSFPQSRQIRIYNLEGCALCGTLRDALFICLRPTADRYVRGSSITHPIVFPGEGGGREDGERGGDGQTDSRASCDEDKFSERANVEEEREKGARPARPEPGW